jgi:SSS family solute:Na+ symporter
MADKLNTPDTVFRVRKQYFSENSLPEKENGWYLVPGRIDKQTYWLLVYFVGTVVALYLFNQLI